MTDFETVNRVRADANPTTRFLVKVGLSYLAMLLIGWFYPLVNS